MAVVFFNNGLVRFFDRALNNGVSGMTTYLILYTNDVTPDPSQILADFTQCLTCVPNIMGLTNGWLISATGGVATCSVNPVDFVFAASVSPDTIYGYVVFDNIDLTDPVLFGERLAVPFPVPTSGCTLRVNISWPTQVCAP